MDTTPTLFVGGPWDGQVRVLADNTFRYCVCVAHEEDNLKHYANCDNLPDPLEPVKLNVSYEYYRECFLYGTNRTHRLFTHEELSMDDVIQLLIGNYKPAKEA